MEKEICTITITNNDQYTLYENGKIKKVYTDNLSTSQVEEWVTPEKIAEQTKDQIIRNCPEDLKEKIMYLLDYP